MYAAPCRSRPWPAGRAADDDGPPERLQLFGEASSTVEGSGRRGVRPQVPDERVGLGPWRHRVVGAFTCGLHDIAKGIGIVGNGRTNWSGSNGTRAGPAMGGIHNGAIGSTRFQIRSDESRRTGSSRRGPLAALSPHWRARHRLGVEGSKRHIPRDHRRPATSDPLDHLGVEPACHGSRCLIAPCLSLMADVIGCDKLALRGLHRRKSNTRRSRPCTWRTWCDERHVAKTAAASPASHGGRRTPGSGAASPEA